MKSEYTFDLNGCARCHASGHEQITFRPLTFPFELLHEAPFTHWAPCPTNGEPIMLRLDGVTPPPEE
jgi:hypothetical protein